MEIIMTFGAIFGDGSALTRPPRVNADTTAVSMTMGIIMRFFFFTAKSIYLPAVFAVMVNGRLEPHWFMAKEVLFKLKYRCN